MDLTNAIRIGEEITEVMEYIPGKIYVRRIIRPKYAKEPSTVMGPGPITCMRIKMEFSYWGALPIVEENLKKV